MLKKPRKKCRPSRKRRRKLPQNRLKISTQKKPKVKLQVRVNLA